MLRGLYFLLSFLPLFVFGQEHIMLVSDPHVMANSLAEPGDAMDAMMAEQRKMLDLSEEAFVALVDTALLYKPALVLIPGDLTKDGEIASHKIIVEQLNRLQQAGIKTLLIPGNHDIGGKAYAYRGAEKTEEEVLVNTAWEDTYAMVYNQISAKDPNSHSYVAEPISGVAVIGIDASHDDGDGYLSDATLDWILSQADAAYQKGKMVIAMCHWQILEHVDQSEMILESGRLQNADVICDKLMKHHVRLVLTGHMHINSISTYRDTLTTSGDSIVEISTGAPITYPCPYRWLKVAPDRSSVEVSTDYLTSLGEHTDLYEYSREWMRKHTENLLPSLSVRLFDKSADVLINFIVDKMAGNQYGNMLVAIIQNTLPKTDEEKIALVKKHLGNTIIEIYLLHSDANEPEHIEADSLAQAMYAGISNMIHELTDAAFTYFPTMQQPLINTVIEAMQQPIQSLVEDRTHWASNYYSDVTDDLEVKLTINEAQPDTNTRIENTCAQADMVIYDILGRRLDSQEVLNQGVYIKNGKKFIKK